VPAANATNTGLDNLDFNLDLDPGRGGHRASFRTSFRRLSRQEIDQGFAAPQDVVLHMLHKCKCRTREYKGILFSFDMKSKRLIEFFTLVKDFFVEQQ